MSLDLSKLEKVVELAGGAKRARCPACAEAGQDRNGEHLRIYPDGRFGCCVFAGERDHRKRIFALAGSRERQEIRVKVVVPQVSRIIQSGLLGRLGRVFGGLAKPALHPATALGTLGTGQYIYDLKEKSTGYVESYNKLKEFPTGVPSVPECKPRLEFETPVPSVPSGELPMESQTGVPGVPRVGAKLPPMAADERLPLLTADGTLSIPFSSPGRYHWWNGGQTVTVTFAEVKRRETVCLMERKGGA